MATKSNAIKKMEQIKEQKEKVVFMTNSNIINEVLQKADAKYRLIISLMAKHQLTPTEIANLNIDNLKEDGLHIDGKVINIDNELTKSLATYVSKNKKRILQTKLLFPGRKEDHLSQNTMAIAIRNIAKKAGYKLQDLNIGLTIRNNRKPKQLLPENATMTDIVNFLSH